VQVLNGYLWLPVVAPVSGTGLAEGRLRGIRDHCASEKAAVPSWTNMALAMDWMVSIP
jgi:hypothetical protein